jgi:hypothetical protein
VLDSLAVSGGSRRPEAALRRLRRLTSVEPTRIARRRLLVRDRKIARRRLRNDSTNLFLDLGLSGLPKKSR